MVGANHVGPDALGPHGLHQVQCHVWLLDLERHRTAPPSNLVDAAGDQHARGGAGDRAGQQPAGIRSAPADRHRDRDAGQPAGRQKCGPADGTGLRPAK